MKDGVILRVSKPARMGIDDSKQPYAIAMKDGAPFGIAGIWENWKEPASGEWIRTFAVITIDANEMVADIHDRMPVIARRLCPLVERQTRSARFDA
jgi:putative SOS response-associated peptidase YedK